MTADEFKATYAAASKITLDQFDSWLDVAACDCGEPGCQGWKATVKANVLSILRTRRVYDQEIPNAN